MKLFIGNLFLLLSLLRQFFKRNLSFKIKMPIAETNEIIILGNGPSLTESLTKYEDLLKQKDIAVVNFFPLSPSFCLLTPKFLVLTDSAFWENDLSEDVLRKIDRMGQILIEQVDWHLTIFLPYISHRASRFKNIILQNSRISLKYYNSASSPHGHKYLQHFFYKKNILMPVAQNVLIAAIFLSIQMRYPIVEILGADHSWLSELSVLPDNILYIRDTHFYDKEINYTPFYSNKIKGETFKVNEVLSILSITFSSYWKLNAYAKDQNITIYNCTENSFIDAFERKRL
ncbi:hypothetical protein [Dysgonomonas sp. HGC4]|uniref:hypothetical protein n=1 Tax=Dysgonomonas sp. HGC4 TaxID=1658009 RepID=UPI0006829CE0|nr:hypothetical protein [Dysgonomonas sp. HGC4]MBD8349066.1 hypothetical protein [Dysgonomonas sp. HGC4]